MNLWTPPVPSSSFWNGVSVQYHANREVSLGFSFEGANDEMTSYELRFVVVWAFKCTYLPAITTEMLESSYDRLIDMGNSDWLQDAQTASEEGEHAIRHLRITFDDGPCFEFLCSAFKALSRSE